MIDLDGKPRDRIGRQILHQLSPYAFLKAVPGLAEQFRPVPESYVTFGREAHHIHCPCEQTVEAPIARLTTCECGRMFLAAASRVVVANSPKENHHDA